MIISVISKAYPAPIRTILRGTLTASEMAAPKPGLDNKKTIKINELNGSYPQFTESAGNCGQMLAKSLISFAADDIRACGRFLHNALFLNDFPCGGCRGIYYYVIYIRGAPLGVGAHPYSCWRL